MTKEDVKTILQMSVEELIEQHELTIDELAEVGVVKREYYSPSESYEYFDGENYYNSFGQQLRSPSEFNPYSEGYTPFGDE